SVRTVGDGSNNAGHSKPDIRNIFCPMILTVLGIPDPQVTLPRADHARAIRAQGNAGCRTRRDVSPEEDFPAPDIPEFNNPPRAARRQLAAFRVESQVVDFPPISLKDVEGLVSRKLP